MAHCVWFIQDPCLMAQNNAFINSDNGNRWSPMWDCASKCAQATHLLAMCQEQDNKKTLKWRTCKYNAFTVRCNAHYYPTWASMRDKYFRHNSGHTQISERCAWGENSMNASVCQINHLFLALHRRGLYRETSLVDTKTEPEASKTSIQSLTLSTNHNEFIGFINAA